MSEKYGIDFIVTSSVKHFERDEIYQQNKKRFYDLGTNKIRIVEFEKKLTEKQSIFTFIKDLLPMMRYSVRQARSCDLIHCRSYGGAVLGFMVSVITRKPFIFDIRGTLPEETVEVDKISQTSLKFTLFKRIEKTLIKRASYVLTVSNKFNDYVKDTFRKKNTININNPADFNMYFSEERTSRRVNFIYSGSMQICHLPELTVKYFSEIYDKFGDKVYLYFCTNDVGKAQSVFVQYKIPRSSYEINSVPFNEMPKYYAKSDIAFCFIKNSFSKSMCFPVKFAEYIACNLYVLANANIGDIGDIVKEYNCGLVFEDLKDIESNIKDISEVVGSMLSDKYIKYDRNKLNFLDWNAKGIESIYNVYKHILNG